MAQDILNLNLHSYLKENSKETKILVTVEPLFDMIRRKCA